MILKIKGKCDESRCLLLNFRNRKLISDKFCVGAYSIRPFRHVQGRI